MLIAIVGRCFNILLEILWGLVALFRGVSAIVCKISWSVIACVACEYHCRFILVFGLYCGSHFSYSDLFIRLDFVYWLKYSLTVSFISFAFVIQEVRVV